MYANAAGGTTGPQITRYNYSQLKDDLLSGGWSLAGCLAGRAETAADGAWSLMTRGRRGGVHGACVHLEDRCPHPEPRGVSPAHPSLPRPAVSGQLSSPARQGHFNRGDARDTSVTNFRCVPDAPTGQPVGRLHPSPSEGRQNQQGPPAEPGTPAGTALLALSLCASPRAGDSRDSRCRCCHLAAR